MIQTQVINYVLDSKDSSFLDSLSEDMFYELKDEYNYIRKHVDLYGNIPDKSSFLDVFRDFDVIEVHESKQYLLDELKKDQLTLRVLNHYDDIRKLINDGKIKEALEYINTTQIRTDSDVQYANLLDARGRYDKYVDKCENFSKYYISTGFKELDNLIGGWDALEELAVIVARPNVGKSQVAIKCATAAVEQGLRVGIYSGEMSEDKVGYRVDTMFQHIANYDLTHGDRRSANEYKAYVDKLPSMYTGALYCLTPDMLKKQASVVDLRRFIEDLNLDILFIDQYSLLEDVHHATKESEKFANLSMELKLLQSLLHKPIIAVSQQHRTSTEDEDIIDVGHIAMSDRIGQDATTVLFLTYKEGILNIHLSKVRDGEKDKKLAYNTNWNFGTFEYIDSSSEKDKNNAGYASSEEEYVFA